MTKKELAQLVIRQATLILSECEDACGDCQDKRCDECAVETKRQDASEARTAAQAAAAEMEKPEKVYVVVNHWGGLVNNTTVFTDPEKALAYKDKLLGMFDYTSGEDDIVIEESVLNTEQDSIRLYSGPNPDDEEES